MHEGKGAASGQWEEGVGSGAQSKPYWPAHVIVQALQGFTTDILLQAGASDPFLSALWAGLARLGGVAVCVFLVDRVGRRPLLIGGAAAIAASYAAMAKVNSTAFHRAGR